MTRSPRPCRSLLAITAAVALTGCAATDGQTPVGPPRDAIAGFPMHLQNCGHPVDIAAPPQRAVSINQPATELMLTLGLADQMIGTASWSDPVLPSLADANARVPLISRNFPSFERLIADDPDFVYSAFDYSFTQEGVAPREEFARFGIPTYQSTSECGGQDAEQQRAWGIDDLYAEIRDIAAIFGIVDRGEQLIESLDGRMTDAAAGLDAADVSMMWWYAATRTPYIAGCCGAPGLITNAVGAHNAFDDSARLWPEISWESILDRDPDVLILADLTRGDDGDSAQAKIDFLQSDPVARRLTAVREKRWIIIAGTAMDPSVRNVDAVEAVAGGLRDLGLAK